MSDKRSYDVDPRVPGSCTWTAGTTSADQSKANKERRPQSTTALPPFNRPQNEEKADQKQLHIPVFLVIVTVYSSECNGQQSFLFRARTKETVTRGFISVPMNGVWRDPKEASQKMHEHANVHQTEQLNVRS